MTDDITKELAETLKELRTKFDSREHLGPSMVRVDAILDRYAEPFMSPEKPKMKINLKDYENKLVVVTLRNEWMIVSLVHKNRGDDDYKCFPYSIDGKNYSNDGRILITTESPYDIIDIKLVDEDPEPVITRVEVITDNGREYVNWNKDNKITTSLQDDGKTLKIFVNTKTTEEPEMPITKPEFYDNLPPGDKTRYNVAENEVSKQWSLALARLIDEIGEEAPSYSEWDAMRTSPEKVVEYLRGLIKHREQSAADEELEACCEWVSTILDLPGSANCLRSDRRPKPTLKSQALKDFETVRKHSDLLPEILDTIENALKSIPE